MRKYGMKIAVAAAVFCMAVPFAAFAGTWRSDANGMWYQFDDGSYPKGRWAWIDTDNDGMAEGFYFDQNGYVLRNTTTPDGYQVNELGAWVQDGEVHDYGNHLGSYGMPRLHRLEISRQSNGCLQVLGYIVGKDDKWVRYKI